MKSIFKPMAEVTKSMVGLNSQSMAPNANSWMSYTSFEPTADKKPVVGKGMFFLGLVIGVTIMITIMNYI